MEKTVPLKKNYEFIRIYKKGKFFAGRYMVLYVFKNNLGKDRLGITISRKFGKSVRRNRLKRLIKECYRFYENFVNDGYDLVFVARRTNIMPEYTQINREMKFLLKKLQVFNEEKWNCSKEY